MKLVCRGMIFQVTLEKFNDKCFIIIFMLLFLF